MYMMNRYFLLAPGAPKAFSVLGGLFSHQTFSHWWWNMAFLYVAGTPGKSAHQVCLDHYPSLTKIPVHEEVGRGTFLSIYLTSGILGYLATLTGKVLGRVYITATLGASAAVYGIMGAYFTLSKTRYITMPEFLGGRLEFSGLIPLLGVLGYEAFKWRMNLKVIQGGSDNLSHVGGIAAGALAGWMVRRRLEEERKEDGEQMVQAPAQSSTPFSTTVTETTTETSW
jgi:rhomboid-like protein